MSFTLRPLAPDDRDWVERFMVEHWGTPTVVAHGAVYRPAELPGFVTIADGAAVGLVTYHIEGRACEIVTLDSLVERRGVGVAVIDAVKGAAVGAGCKRLWMVTTNDNTRALRFYQKRGFALVALRANAVAASRQLKPEIPLFGNDGIPIRDEIELEVALDRDR